MSEPKMFRGLRGLARRLKLADSGGCHSFHLKDFRPDGDAPSCGWGLVRRAKTLWSYLRETRKALLSLRPTRAEEPPGHPRSTRWLRLRLAVLLAGLLCGTTLPAYLYSSVSRRAVEFVSHEEAEIRGKTDVFLSFLKNQTQEQLGRLRDFVEPLFAQAPVQTTDPAVLRPLLAALEQEFGHAAVAFQAGDHPPFVSRLGRIPAEVAVRWLDAPAPGSDARRSFFIQWDGDLFLVHALSVPASGGQSASVAAAFPLGRTFLQRAHALLETDLALSFGSRIVAPNAALESDLRRWRGTGALEEGERKDVLARFGDLLVFREGAVLKTADGKPVDLLLAVPVASVLGPLVPVHRELAILCAVLGLAVCTSVHLAFRRFLRPIEQLAGAARRIAVGELGARVPEEPYEGVGFLARMFNDMAERLELSNNRLETKVRERTEALTVALEEVRRSKEIVEETNERLEDMDRVKDAILVNVSHEMRTPLTSVAAYAEILESCPPEEEGERREFCRIIRDEAMRLAKLIESILAFARLRGGADQLSIGPIDFRDVVQAATESLRPLFQEKGLRLAIRLPDAFPRVAADRERLHQVLVNLLGNAVKFTPPGGEVEVQARVVDWEVEVAVRDTGEGIPPADLERIFERFARAGSGAEVGGFGLGLAISREIVQQHGGRMSVESEVGRGSRFVFTLPLAPRLRFERNGKGHVATTCPGASPPVDAAS